MKHEIPDLQGGVPRCTKLRHSGMVSCFIIRRAQSSVSNGMINFAGGSAQAFAYNCFDWCNG